MNKVAEVTIFFWIMKVLATTLGETAGDFISMSLGLGYYFAFGVTFMLLVIILFFQIKADRYRAILYWTAIIATTTAGTEVSDLMDRSLGLGYAAGSLILTAGLLGVLTLWYYRDRNLSVYPIIQKDAETTYWLAIVFSNSLGTAFGDFLTSDLGLGYVQGALVTATVIGAVILLHYLTKSNEILLFWIAFIFTRPFGATFGDFLTKPAAQGGLEISRGYASIITLSLLLLVLYFSMQTEIKMYEDSPSKPFRIDSMQNFSGNVSKVLIRVPAVTLYFWVIKIMATTVGETTADFLSMTLRLGLVTTSIVMGGLLIMMLFNQFRLQRYVPMNYWLTVVSVSIVGTLVTDLLVDGYGVSLVTATVGFGIFLIIVFAAWHLSENTLAMHSIHTAKREIYYWAAIFTTFALGTAAGDLLSEASGLGYLQSALVFGSAIFLITLAYYIFDMNEILTFWLAYILTRPLGASLGDLLSQPAKNGGFGFGTVGTSVMFLTTIAILISYLTITRKDQIRVAAERSD